MPIFAALATAIPSVLSAGAGLAGNVITGQNSAKAVKDAAAAQGLAADKAIGAINGNSGTNAGLFAPFINSGTNALSQLDILLGLGAPSTTPAAGTAMSSTPSWTSYVQNNPDVLAAYNSYGKAQGTSMDAFGKWHWDTFGQNEYNSGNPSRVYTPYGPAQSQAQAGAAGPAAPQGSAAAQQQAAIDELKASPLYQSLFRNGEQAVLANGAATGGLRGGNTEHSLYNVANDTLAQVIQQQVANLGGLAGSGQAAAGSLSGLNTNSTGAIAGLLGQQGASTAGGILGVNNANNSVTSSLLNGLGSLAGNSQFTGSLSTLATALGLGGGIRSTATSSALGPQYNIPASSYAPAISPALQGLSF